ncbi:MAG: CPBP family intramembrane metalloprotease [Parasporobacterium sp.]|nr:CPBP family intramembrane metalloprotease [Parasporobacterium sp.]
MSTGRKIWRIIYPILLFGALNLGLGLLVYPLLAGASWPVSLAVNAGKEIVIIAFMVFFFKKDNPVQSAYSAKNPLNWLWFLLTGIFFGQGLGLFVNMLQLDKILGNYEEMSAAVFASHPLELILSSAILVPIAEELTFRGLIYNRIKSSLGFWPAALISSAVFGIAHLNLAQGVYAFFLGLVMAAVYKYADHIIAPVLVHVGANGATVLLYLLNFSFELSWMSWLYAAGLMLLGAAVLFLLVRPIVKKTAKQG